MDEKSMQPQDMTSAEVASLDDANGINGQAEARDLDNVTIEYDPSSEVMQTTARDQDIASAS